MASNSRVILLLGGGGMIAAAAIASANSGEGWIIPMAILLSIITAILVFSVLTSGSETMQGSTPFTSHKEVQTKSPESENEDLPDPTESGIDLPIL